MRTVRIGQITTVSANIADDFIRDRIEQLLRYICPGIDLRFLAINRHKPLTVYPGWHPLRWLKALDHLPRGERAAAMVRADASEAVHRFGGSRFEKMDFDQIEDEFETLVTQRTEERERLVLLRDSTWNKGVDAVIRATSS